MSDISGFHEQYIHVHFRLRFLALCLLSINLNDSNERKQFYGLHCEFRCWRFHEFNLFSYVDYLPSAIDNEYQVNSVYTNIWQT